jgi:predicted secreted protein
MWWITLFTILPFRLGADEGERDEFAEASGAPSSPRLALKFLLTTLVSAALFAMVYVVFAYRLISLNDFPSLQL